MCLIPVHLNIWKFKKIFQDLCVLLLCSYLKWKYDEECGECKELTVCQ